MNFSRIFIFAIFAICTVCKADTAVLGFTLGKPIALNECAYKAAPAPKPVFGLKFMLSDGSLGPGISDAMAAQVEVIREAIHGKGLLVVEVAALSVAERADIKVGDVISQLDATEIRSQQDVARFMASLVPPASVVVRGSRNQKDFVRTAAFEGVRKRYESSQQSTCFQDFAQITGYGQPARRIHMTREESPVWVKNSQMIALEKDGNLIGLDFFTYGVSSQDVVLEALKQKFGPPTTSGQSEGQTLQGARFPILSASWLTREVRVQFEGATDRIDSGRVTIDTPEAAALRKAWSAPSPNQRAL